MPPVNPIAIATSAIASMAIGYAWYSPMLFGNQWMKLAGIKPPGNTNDPQLKKKMAYSMGGMLLASIVTMFSIATVIAFTKQYSLASGAAIGVMLAIGFIAMNRTSDFLFEGKPKELYAINAGYAIVSYAVAGAIIGALG